MSYRVVLEGTMGSIHCPEIFEGVYLWAPTTKEEKLQAPKFNADLARKMFVDNFIFFETACVIKTEGDKRKNEPARITNPVATEMQQITGWAAWLDKWIIVIKHRQAKMSTFFVLTTLLRDCMFIEGYTGVLIANSEDTVGQLFDRLTMAYDNLPPEIKVPCRQDGKSKSAKYIYFAHGGSITIMTAGGKSIGAGWSVDRAVISELGEMPLDQQTKLLESFIPAVAKRSHSRVIIETTPGSAGSALEDLWHITLEASIEAQFKPCFLRWVDDHTCEDDIYEGFEESLTDDEKDLLGRIDGIQLGHIAFRRRLLKSGMPGQASFEAKYPRDPYSGWRGADDPVIDADLVRCQLAQSRSDADFARDPLGLSIVVPYFSGHRYWIFCDSNKPGAEGDPSALTIVDRDTWDIVARWEGREEPDLFAFRAVRAGTAYGGRNCILVFEGNSGEAFTAARMILASIVHADAPRLYTGPQGRGWWASEKSLARAHGRLMKLMRDGDLIIPFKSILHQFLHYDGQKKKRLRNSSGKLHHFDAARTIVMAADLIVETAGRAKEVGVSTNSFIEGMDPSTGFGPEDYFESYNSRMLDKLFNVKPKRWQRNGLTSLRQSATMRFGVGRG